MHVVDFAQAEAPFAELLGRVQAGEEVLVTRANVPVAELEFPSKSEQPARDWVAGGLLSGR
jgi:antitoxin (DNA-binding transcriptional repressor) of toxin-antitoxin stability system